MDASEDRDIKLQRASSDLIKELRVKLPSLLWKSGPCSHGSQHPHRWAQSAKTDRLIILLEPFQEWPQLLDPHLHEVLTHLIEAFLAYLRTHREQYVSNTTVRYQHLDGVYPLPRAICKILYVLCKVRGMKVVSRFFNNEPKNLELLLRAFLAWDATVVEGSSEMPSKGRVGPMIWEERYIMLLWLSHLLLAPFDLASISSDTIPVPYDNLSALSDTLLQFPRIAHSILSISLRYVVLPGKEGEAATILLARLALRLDMQQLGLLDILTKWALHILRSNSGEPLPPVSTCIGVLSFLARLGVSGRVDDLAPLAVPIFDQVLQFSQGQSRLYETIISSASARKVIIKILRTIAILVLSLQERSSDRFAADKVPLILEDAIDYFLVALADKDTPVRFAASKALSMVAVKLDSNLASEVIEAVISSLDENILYEKLDGSLITPFEAQSLDFQLLKRNISAVDPLRWQGLVLTLAHLLFRRSPPASQLSRVLQSLVSGLDFEQRSSTGSSIGTNVRDASCFGIWALSRKYTTAELRDLDAQAVKVTIHQKELSILQALAIELVCAACLDPSGNIRRGASAALQELIGRHPDTIFEGISLVQVVDYHAVARRSRAMLQVAKNAAALGSLYWDPLVSGLLQWRGIGSRDAQSRRTASIAIGELSLQESYKTINTVIQRILQRFSGIPLNAVEVRHGVLLSLAATIDAFTALQQDGNTRDHDNKLRDEVATEIRDLWAIFDSPIGPSKEALTLPALRPDLTAEASARLLSSLARSCVSTCEDAIGPLIWRPSGKLLQRATDILELCVLRGDDIPIEASSRAASDIFVLLPESKQSNIIQGWFGDINASRKTAMGRGQIAALGAVFGRIPRNGTIRNFILEELIRCAGAEEMIEKRVSAVRSITTGVLPQMASVDSVAEKVQEFLNDYTTDRRGDVGSSIRLEAVEAVKVILGLKLAPDSRPPYLETLISRVARLAAEKLDKVRFQAWSCLQILWQSSAEFPALKRKYDHFSEISSPAYFLQLFELFHVDWLRRAITKGLVTSISAGTELLVRSTRFALLEYISTQNEEKQNESKVVLFGDLLSILQNNLEDDRYAIPTMETLAFLLDSGVAPSPEDLGSGASYRKLFLLVQKSHYKSSNFPRLEAAIKIYAVLWRISDIRAEVTKKMTGMLLHPYPKIRSAVADSLFMETGADELKMEDWTAAPSQLNQKVKNLRDILGNCR